MSVLIVLGSKNDLPVGEKCKAMLNQFSVENRMIVASAHRSPEYLHESVENSNADVFIAIAGLSAALPGFIASMTTKPVIGVPVHGELNLDSILSMLQMPPGVPVGAVGLDRGENAAILAVEILALRDKHLQEKLEEHRRKLREWIVEDSESIGD